MALLAEFIVESDHVHVAAPNRKRILHIARVARNRFGCSVRELVPFDDIDCVHVPGSWHYRTQRTRWIRRSCPKTRWGRRHRKNLAADISGGNLSGFIAWVRKRYQ